MLTCCTLGLMLAQVWSASTHRPLRSHLAAAAGEAPSDTTATCQTHHHQVWLAGAMNWHAPSGLQAVPRLGKGSCGCGWTWHASTWP